MYKILLLSIIAILSGAVIHNTYAESIDLNPLVLKQPEDFSVTMDTITYNYQVSKSSFLAVDDDGKTPIISCSINSQRLLSGSYHNFFKWSLPEGDYEVYCEVEDTTGNITEVTWNVSIVRDVLAPSWFKTIANWYARNTIDQDMYLKIIKYFHTAEVLEFDIFADTPEDSPRVPSSFQSNTSRWSSGSLDNSAYKSILENMADDGVFLNVNI